MGYLATPKSRKNIREDSAFIRKIQPSENQLYFDIVKFIEITLPQLIPKFSLSIGTIEEMGQCHGLTFPDRNEIVIREDVYTRACEGNGRDRLTMAHEVYHYIEHSSDSIIFARTDGTPQKRYYDPEWQATVFGAELLIPYDLVKKLNLSPDEIAKKCGVSLAAATFQYNIIHKNDVKSGSLFT